MLRKRTQSAVSHVGLALRDPESFAAAWNSGAAGYRWWVWVALACTAILGTSTYGLTMGLLGGPAEMVRKALACTLAAGLAWAIPLPALYILSSLDGSRLRLSSTFLATLVTTSWGGLAMIASIPMNWFFTTAIPHGGFVLLINLLVFTGVGVAMVDVFRRVMLRLEPERGSAPLWWLVLVGIIGLELFYCLDLFQFGGA